MPGLKNPHQSEIPISLEQTFLNTTDCVWFEFLLAEGIVSRTVAVAAGDCCVGDGFAAGPVTDPICVAGPEEDVDACVQKRCECCEGGACIFIPICQ